MAVDRQPVRKPTYQPGGQPVGGSTARRGIPPLAAGDHLSRAEFERRYEAMPYVKKAELVEGVVYMPSPVSAHHGRPHAIVMGWLLAYVAATPGAELFDNTSLRIDARSELQPDAMVLLDEARGGACRVERDGFVAGSPEFVVEVAASSASYDMHSKLRVYQRNGVQEYLVLLAYERDVRWYNWQTGEDRLLAPDEDGILRSLVFPGLWLDPQRFWQGDIAAVLSTVQQGLAAPQHAEFVARLNQARQRQP